MQFTNTLFLFFFLPGALILYYLSGKRLRELTLVVLSLLFYAVGSRKYFILFLIAVIGNVVIGRTIHRSQNRMARKILLITGIVLDCGVLIYYKYTDFAISIINDLAKSDIPLRKILLPMGISFFTFKAISYLIDVYTGKADLEDRPGFDMLYLSFFGQIISGPLTRYNDMKAKQITEKGRFHIPVDLFSEGVTRFLIGFNKKVLLANVLANITNEVFAAPLSQYSVMYAWLGSICYSLQLFFDFAGYSDMAIGISNMFGYDCMENFKYPYMTQSVAGFWRRWHISLSEWFRDYIYIPLGGSRNQKKYRVYFNLLVVWLLTGIWHGAAWNFIAWGMGYFILISFERMTGLPKRLNKPWKFVYRIFTLIFINCQWILFRATDIRSGISIILRLFWVRGQGLTDMRSLFLIREYFIFILAAVIFSFPVVPWIEKKLRDDKKLHTAFEIILSILLLCGFVWSLSFVIAGQNNPFAYANF